MQRLALLSDAAFGKDPSTLSKRARGMKVRIAVFLAFLALATLNRAGEVLPPGGGAKGVVVPLYVAGQAEPAAVLRIEKVYTDFQRRGFFRIGLLPMLVAEGVEVELRSQEHILAALKQVGDYLQRRGRATTLELRRVVIELPGRSAPRLEAGRVRFRPEGSWELAGGVRWRGASAEVQASSGTFCPAGDRAGQLLMATDNGPVEVRICNPSLGTSSQAPQTEVK
jgi:hypothetical protein